MKKISRNDVLAILAALGVSSGSAVLANSNDSNDNGKSLGKVEHQGSTYLGDESKCGKGSCGKDEKGAAAAKKKHAEKKKDEKKEKEEKKKEDKK